VAGGKTDPKNDASKKKKKEGGTEAKLEEGAEVKISKKEANKLAKKEKKANAKAGGSKDEKNETAVESSGEFDKYEAILKKQMYLGGE
jgi:hypothetical protein